MLIVNADDVGRNAQATDNTLRCHKEGSITSGSAMVFMKDSRRAADRAAESGLETGLHLNMSEPFDASSLPRRIQENQAPIIRYYRRGRWPLLTYNPFLKKHVDYAFKAQYDEYVRLYGAEPSKLDGHHHMHLSANILLANLIPKKTRIRRSFTFAPGEKNLFNRAYRRIIDAWLMRRFVCPDSLFSIKPLHEPDRLKRIIGQALSSNIELLTHPDDDAEYCFLLSPDFRRLIEGVPRGTYRMIADRLKKAVTQPDRSV
jgi:hypothetical protein